jgi:hypothetical protein
MRRLQYLAVGLLIGLFAAGCGNSGLIKAKGRVLKGGQPYRTGEGQGLRIFFAPVEIPGKEHYDSYAAEYHAEDGTFQVKGKDGAGLPPGKYRVGIQLMKNRDDLLGGKLLGKNSPLTCEITGSHDDLVIDLDQTKFDELLAAAGKPKKGR